MCNMLQITVMKGRDVGKIQNLMKYIRKKLFFVIHSPELLDFINKEMTNQQPEINILGETTFGSFFLLCSFMKPLLFQILRWNLTAEVIMITLTE